MIDLNFSIDNAEPVLLAATPQLCFKLAIDAAEDCKSVPIQSVQLRVQVSH